MTEKFDLSEAEISKYADGFGVTPEEVVDFLAKSLVMEGISPKLCSRSNHPIAPGFPAFLFDWTDRNMGMYYCVDPRCFLGGIDPEGQPQSNGSGGKPAGRSLEAEQAAGLKTLQMARRRARVKVRDRPADRQPAEREMTFSKPTRTPQPSSACHGLSAVGHANGGHCLLAGYSCRG